jgi:hypothetical protein
MKSNQIKSVFLLLTFAAILAQPLQATIEKVKLQAGATANAANLSNEISVQNSNSTISTNLGLVGIGPVRLPFVINVSHLVTLTGDWLNTCDRVEILNASGTIVQTLRDAALTKTTVSGKGQLKFTVPSTRLTGVGNFEIRVRYFIETNGFDVLKCRVVNRGVINSITWVGTNLPVITNVTGGERSTLTRELEYKLQFTGTGFGTTVDLTDIPNGPSSTGFPISVTSTVVNSTGTVITITMKPGSGLGQFFVDPITVQPDLQDFVNGNNFEIIGLTLPGSNLFGPYLMYDFNNLLSTAGSLTNLAEITVTPPPPPPPAPDLRPGTPTSFGTTYKFGTLTVTDQQGKIYKNIDAAQDNNDLGTQLSSNSSSVIGNTSRCVSKELGNDPTLGVVTLHQITMGNYTCPITNQGNANATAAFTNTFRGNMVAAAAPVLPTQAALTRFTTFPTVTTVSQTLPSLNQGITNNNIVHKRMIQVFTFSNRPGAFYCDNAWPVEQGNTTNSLITITVDTNKNVNEGTEGGETNNVYPAQQ